MSAAGHAGIPVRNSLTRIIAIPSQKLWKITGLMEIGQLGLFRTASAVVHRQQLISVLSMLSEFAKRFYLLPGCNRCGGHKDF